MWYLRTQIILMILMIGTSGFSQNRPSLSAKSDALNSKQFQKKLNTMLRRVEKSIKLIKEQISQNQSAPFLPDLYLQLGTLLSQKSNVYYYIQMEHAQKVDQSSVATKKMGPVVEAQKEAVEVFMKLVKEFPDFDKQAKVYYLLSLSLKSIDEKKSFNRIVTKLIEKFPKSKEAMRGRLLLGQDLYDRMEYKRTASILEPVTRAGFPYEKNQAKYRIGMSYLKRSKHKEALSILVQVVKDEDFEEEDNPVEISLKSKIVGTNLRREALIDSVLAYTHVYKKNPNPVEFYSEIAPTEALFQETIEKLAFRYIYLRKFQTAVKLLRTLSERTSDPQKVINIYQEVLTMIPIKKRIDIKAEEMVFVIEKFSRWLSYYEVSPQTRKVAYRFLETQLRELGTASHQVAKKLKGKQRVHYLTRSKEFYDLYLGFFGKSTRSVQIASNLADVHFQLGNFLESGDYYLRTFEQRYGPAKNRKLMIKNAISALQKEKDYSFYEQVRTRGLLIKSITRYLAYDKKQQRNTNLNFLLVKSEYDQGMYNTALPNLFAFMKKFRKTSRAVDAGELILNYYNTRGDYKGLFRWTDRMAKAPIANRKFMAKVTKIRELAKSKQLAQEIKALKNYDAFSEGRGYLQVAMRSDDDALKSAALQQALGRSKKEGDYATFFKTARVMSDQEKDRSKKANILRSTATENIAITRFYRGLGDFKRIYADKNMSESDRIKAYTESFKLASMLKDMKVLEESLGRSEWKELPSGTKKQFLQQLEDLFTSPINSSPKFQSIALSSSPTDSMLTALFKAQFRISSQNKKKLYSSIKSRCKGKAPSSTACKWGFLPGVDSTRVKFLKSLRKAPASMKGINAYAPKFLALTEKYKRLENSNDPHLDTVLSIRNLEIYQAFGNYLKRASRKQKDIRSVLQQKSKESYQTAKVYLNACQSLKSQAAAINPALKYCGKKGSPALKKLLSWNFSKKASRGGKDPETKKFRTQNKKLFMSSKDPDVLLDTATAYYKAGKYHHASASALYGVASFPRRKADFRSVVGCSALKIGLLTEASYHLNNASSHENMKAKCLKQLNMTVLGL